jgi:hypothetical protein
MTRGLPRGLILVEDNPTHGTEQEDDDDEPRLDVATIAKTWRIYTASRNAIAADTGYRLENLFWRTWSNPTLLRNLHPSTFTNVVQHIGSGRGHVQLSRPPHFDISVHGQDEDDSTPVPSGPPTATASPIQQNSTPASSSEYPRHVRQSSDSSVKPPQSILKKPSTDQQYAGPTAEQLLVSAEKESKPESTKSSSSTSDTVSPPSSERPRMKRQLSAGNKKASFVANTSGRAKARPSVPRKKSSQGTVPQAKQKEPLRSPIKSPIKPPSPLQGSSGNEPFPETLAANPMRRGKMGPPPGLSLPASGASGPAFLLPSASSWQSVESTSPSRAGLESLIQNSMPLVDPDFRKQFVEARSASQINLAGAGMKMRKTGSVVRFAEDLPDIGRGKAKESVLGPGRRGSGAEARRSSLSENTPAIDDTDEEDSEDEGLSMLPRTRSQLSLAIRQRRRNSGSQHLGRGPEHGSSQSKGKGKGGAMDKAKEKEKEDTEDELLKMGRQDGVTKAGGPRSRHPLRASPPQHQRDRSPTPPPIF